LAVFSLLALAALDRDGCVLHRILCPQFDYQNSFGHILPATEFWMFALPVAAIFSGFFELMMREKTGLPRPAIGCRLNRSMQHRR